MAILRNSKHERFAQNLAAGMSQGDAYADAGYRPHRGNASKLAQDQNIVERVQELLDRRDKIEHAATEKAIERLSITKEAVLEELRRIGFADIRKAVEWRGHLIRETDNPDGGDVLVVKEIFSNNVRLIDSDQIDDETASAIAEVRQSPTGGLSIKFHDKQAALVNLGKHLGLFKERIEHTGKDGGPIQTEVSARDTLADRIAGIASRKPEGGDTGGL